MSTSFLALALASPPCWLPDWLSSRRRAFRRPARHRPLPPRGRPLDEVRGHLAALRELYLLLHDTLMVTAPEAIGDRLPEGVIQIRTDRPLGRGSARVWQDPQRWVKSCLPVATSGWPLPLPPHPARSEAPIARAAVRW